MLKLTESQWAFVLAAGRELGIEKLALDKWRSRSTVPWRHRPKIAAKARKAGVRLPRDFLMDEAA